MRRVYKSTLTITVCSLVTFGCGNSDPKPPPKPEDTVFGDMISAKEKARRDTEKAMEENQRKLDEAMKKNEETSAQ